VVPAWAGSRAGGLTGGSACRGTGSGRRRREEGQGLFEAPQFAFESEPLGEVVDSWKQLARLGARLFGGRAAIPGRSGQMQAAIEPSID